jgi:aspartate racemase
LRETAQGLAGWCEYDTDLFEGLTITRMLGHYQRLIEAIVADPDRRISDLPLLTEPERHQLVAEWNRTQVDCPRGRCLHQLMAQQAARTPTTIAAIGAGQEITYRELDESANRLAQYLCRIGIRPEACIAICLERSPKFLIALLGVLKAGGAYLPLDPSYPKERFTALLHDARCPVVLTTRDLRDKVAMGGLREICLDSDWQVLSLEPPEAPDVPVDADNLAYVIYTSGSTGMPKGVAVTHAAAISHFMTFAQNFGFQAGDRALQFSSLAVDFSLEDIFPTRATTSRGRKRPG